MKRSTVFLYSRCSDVLKRQLGGACKWVVLTTYRTLNKTEQLRASVKSKFMNTAQLGPQKSVGSRQITLRRMLCIVLIMQCLAVVIRADVSKQELQKWIDDSTLIFTGTIVALDSNVSGITAADNPMTVKVDRVDSSNDQIKKNFGSLVGKELTVVVDRVFTSAPERKVGVSAVFFVNPLSYEKNIAVTAVAVADKQTVKNLPTRLRPAIEQKNKQPLTQALTTADTVIAGVVQEIRPLPDPKIEKLRALDNGYDLYSEHSPRWREAVIRVQSVLKGDKGEKMLLVIFPSTEDLMWENSPKFKANQSGTWLLHSVAQLGDERARILLEPEPFQGNELKIYTALAQEDFLPRDSAGKNQALIRETLKSLKP
jgi:hypothetical protein